MESLAQLLAEPAKKLNETAKRTFSTVYLGLVIDSHILCVVLFADP